MFSRILKSYRRYGWTIFLRLGSYTILSLLSTPFVLIRTLRNCLILFKGKWADYPHFYPHSGINSLFYWTAAENINNYGRSGISPILGTGNYHLSRWFHYTLLSLNMYRNAGAVTILAGMLGWLLMHFIWIFEFGLNWVTLVILITLISTTFYSVTFTLMNYNSIGWIFVPLGLYGLCTEQWTIAAIAWLACSFGSFTVVFLVGALSLIVGIFNWDLYPILATVPAAIKILTHFIPLIINGDIKNSIASIYKGIGVSNKKAIYKRDKSFGIVGVYFLLLYLQFLISCITLNNPLYYLIIVGIVVFIFNVKIRFADGQSIYMFLLSLATVTVIHSTNYYLLISYWIMVSPIPYFAGFPFKGVYSSVPEMKPFSIKLLLERMETFLEPAQPGERVLMAFERPLNYESIFDGYRVLLELPLFIAAKKKIHFMPDWWAVFENNYEGAPEFWGRDIKNIIENIEKWQANYVVIYSNLNDIKDIWQQNGFKILGVFNWGEYTDIVGDIFPNSEPPTWWLLKRV